jgi:hypothetical protein
MPKVSAGRCQAERPTEGRSGTLSRQGADWIPAGARGPEHSGDWGKWAVVMHCSMRQWERGGDRPLPCGPESGERVRSGSRVGFTGSAR